MSVVTKADILFSNGKAVNCNCQLTIFRSFGPLPEQVAIHLCEKHKQSGAGVRKALAKLIEEEQIALGLR